MAGEIAVLGGTGTIGRHIVQSLREGGADPRVLSRRSESFAVDLSTGAGLEAALRGCEVIIDAANGSMRRPEAVLVDGARRLIDAAARAGVGHLVTVSIVGIESAPGRYYRAKLAQEQLVRDGPVPWTIVRSTQFHELLAGVLSALGRWRLSPRAQARFQPIAAAEAARAVVAAAGSEPQRRLINIAGPEVLSLSELARAYERHHGRRVIPLALPLPGKTGTALKQGVLTCPQPETAGTISFASWLAQQD